ncbi:hypothetical protein Taro_023344 [Colocasia esculenta]|uniref:CCHC-type domain-containing protein n=1 Tax=Colocasia esculenta TaxID=4460 RepID=A0A843VE77_COLES|nr:hypothetical protein [Colocasia esculenta]
MIRSVTMESNGYLFSAFGTTILAGVHPCSISNYFIGCPQVEDMNQFFVKDDLAKVLWQWVSPLLVGDQDWWLFSGDLLRQGGTLDIRLHIPGSGVLRGSSQKPEWRCFGGFLALAEEGFSDLGLVQAMQTQAHTQAALLAQMEAQERADVWLFRAKFVPEHIQDRMEPEFLSLTQGSKTVLEYEARFAELSKYAPHIVANECRKAKKFVMGLKPSLKTRLVAFDHRTLDEALSAACRQEGEMEQYLEEKKALQKRPATPFQRQDKKKAAYQTPQRPVVASSTQVPSQRSPGVKKECPHCGKTHSGTECWMVAGKCLKCGSSDHKIKDCPRLQQESSAERQPQQW